MSNVQLSSTTTLERLVARRTFPLHARTGVCRSLFGPVDHDELNREMRSRLRELSDRDRRRWNFNFETDTPLSGDYNWEEVPVDATPAFYRGPRTGSAVPALQLIDTVQKNGAALDVSGHSTAVDHLCGPEVSLPRPGEVNQENCSDTRNSDKLKRKAVSCKRTSPAMARITDFYGIKRRMTEVNLRELSTPSSAPPVPVERTPRKRIP